MSELQIMTDIQALKLEIMRLNSYFSKLTDMFDNLSVRVRELEENSTIYAINMSMCKTIEAGRPKYTCPNCHRIVDELTKVRTKNPAYDAMIYVVNIGAVLCDLSKVDEYLYKTGCKFCFIYNNKEEK